MAKRSLMAAIGCMLLLGCDTDPEFGTKFTNYLNRGKLEGCAFGYRYIVGDVIADGSLGYFWESGHEPLMILQINLELVDLDTGAIKSPTRPGYAHVLINGSDLRQHSFPMTIVRGGESEEQLIIGLMDKDLVILAKLFDLQNLQVGFGRHAREFGLINLANLDEIRPCLSRLADLNGVAGPSF